MDPREQRWASTVRNMLRSTAFEDSSEYVQFIPYLPLKARKELLKIARCQSSPSYNSFLKSQTTTLQTAHYRSKKFYGRPGARHAVLYLSEIIEKLSDNCHRNAAFSSILSVLVRSAPIFLLSTETIQENRDDSFDKELQASIGQDRDKVLDYTLFFSEHPDYDRALSRFLPPAPLRNRQIHDRFFSWRKDLLHRTPLLYPQLTSYRNISRVTCSKYHEFHGRPDGLMDRLYDVNAIDLERTYAETGVQISGACELRQAWKFNDLTPRTYFALGGTTFHSSKYIRTIANQLCNLFDPTGFKSRFSISRIPVQRDHTVYTYDYSSFTSNFTELKYFIRELAEFMEGVPIDLIDSYEGRVTVDLSDLLLNYLKNTTHRPEFTINRYLSTCYENIVHQKAGMLGVYGNIALSTALHGLHACQLCGDDGECNCVGDDVLGSGPIDDCFFDAILSLGDVNQAKVKSWDYEDPSMIDGFQDRRWPYTKRPLERFGNKILLETAYFLPIYGAILPTVDNVRDITSDDITQTEIRILAVQSCSLVRQLAASPPETDEQAELIIAYMRTLYKAARISSRGVYPWMILYHEGEMIRNVLIPDIDSFRSPYNLWDAALDLFESGVHKVPEAFYPSDENLYSYRKLVEKREIICFDNRVISYGRKMEYLSVVPRYIDRVFDSLKEYSDYYTEIFERVRLRTYDVVCLGGPQWFFDLCNE